MLRNWRTLKVGDKVHYYGKDFDGEWDYICEIVKVDKDFVIVEWDEIRLYLDDETKDLFRADNYK